ncbi:alkaline phosphatase D family protein [Solicola sp. PLA-1-18]|uniref:alkaline phosphatase D family protein n=1 Tax=Solicola sp. PLA-1-18 TaxID=3380532 RepID=UPI003B829BC5
MPDDALVLGPLLRHTDETSAVVWAQVASAATVTVVCDGRRHDARTFSAHGHHYAVVDVEGLERGSSQPYELEVDGVVVWPPTDATVDGHPYPSPRIRTLDHGRPLQFLYGSCRTSVPHDAEHHRTHGVDTLRAYALRLADGVDNEWVPDFALFLGDQVYADETSEAMQDFIASRRSLDEEPGTELKDFEEYAHLYLLAWSDPANRWLLSTLSSLMIFDDHDVRDDWNTSRSWREEMEATQWWHGRIVAALASYWVYQHVGNLSPAARAEDEIWRCIEGKWARGEDDVTDVLDAFADRVDQHPETYQWSYVRDLGRSRLIVVDTRAARDLTPGARRILDDGEARWLLDQATGDVDHVFVGTSLPFLMSQAVHEFEAWNEAIAEGAWGKRILPLGEKVRQTIDLEHWAAFQHSFRVVAEHARKVASGELGAAPATICFLSGDVHHSYLSEVDGRVGSRGTRLLQAVCSPIRNPLPRAMRTAQTFANMRIGSRLGRALSRSARVPDPPFTWSTTAGPWFENQLASVRVRGRDLDLRWEGAPTPEGDATPTLSVTHDFTVEERGTR